jgi:hypothetical protein
MKHGRITFRINVTSGSPFVLLITFPHAPVALSSRFVRDDCSGIVIDTETGLEWLEGPPCETQWFELQQWLEELEEDWRVPDPEELQLLYISGITWSNPEPFMLDGNFIWYGNISSFDSISCFDFISGMTIRVADWSAYEYVGGFRAMAVRESPGD